MTGEVLFGAGAGPFPVVQEERRPPQGPRVRRLLAEVFGQLVSWRYGYRASRLEAIAAPASRDDLLEAFGRTVARVRPGGAHLFYFSGHGSLEGEPWGPTLWLWGDQRISLAELAGVLDRQPTDRMYVLVLAQCYAGAFAPVLHPGADPAGAPGPGCRCGFFATLGDRESTGCTTARRPQDYDDYSLRLAESLAGRNAAGMKVAGADLDGDGRVGLAEAHAYARIHERSMDVPTCTSEHWLRVQASPHGPGLDLASGFDALLSAARPTERAVLAGLRSLLPKAAPLPVLQARYEVEQLSAALQGLDAQAEALLTERDGAANTLITDLSARWPVLEEPWHSDFDAALQRSGAAIASFIEAHPKLPPMRSAARGLDLLERQRDLILLRQAALERLVRAAENVTLEADLRRRGGPAVPILDRLYACESWVPGDGAPPECTR